MKWYGSDVNRVVKPNMFCRRRLGPIFEADYEIEVFLMALTGYQIFLASITRICRVAREIIVSLSIVVLLVP
jgi:hypothetical protein